MPHVEMNDPQNIDKFQNLMLNFLGGLRPQELSKEEVQLLENRIGENWFKELGFDKEDEFAKPSFE